MKYTFALLALSFQFFGNAQTNNLDTVYLDAAYVDFDTYLQLAHEVQLHRSERMVSYKDFVQMSGEENTVILDTRSTEMYNAKHLKGAIHLDFSDFTQERLAQLIPDTNTRILIYCNNNIANDELYFPTKSLSPREWEKIRLNNLPNGPKEFAVTMALNIPTYINLYGYGYRNVYELKDLVSVYFGGAAFEGTEISSN